MKWIVRKQKPRDKWAMPDMEEMIQQVKALRDEDGSPLFTQVSNSALEFSGLWLRPGQEN